MAITFNVTNPNVVTLEEFMDYVNAEIDVRDLESISSAAHMLRGLANERELVVRQLNWQIKNLFGSDALAATQALFLGQGRDFYVRANLWPSSSDLSTGRVLQDHFVYHVAHDHNYHFMTAAYHGPGYYTDIFQYDHKRVEGRIGERVELKFMERVQFRAGMVMLYEASKDIHTQQPPDDLSITLNLMIRSPSVQLRDQYIFDLDKQVLIRYPEDTYESRRVSVVRMAAQVGDDNTRQILDDLSHTHPSRRTRLAAYESLAQLDPANRVHVWERACSDPEVLIALAGRKALESSG